MVCLSSRSPHAAALLRKAARIADRLGAPGTPSMFQTPREALNTSMLPRSARSGTVWTSPDSWAARRWPSKVPISSVPLPLSSRNMDYPRGPRTDAAAFPSPLVRRSILDRLLQTIPGVDVIVVDNSPPLQS